MFKNKITLIMSYIVIALLVLMTAVVIVKIFYTLGICFLVGVLVGLILSTRLPFPRV